MPIKRPSITIFLAAFAAVAVITFIANVKSVFVKELSFGFNNGVSQLSTWQNSLVAFSLDKTAYVWNWNDLSAEHINCPVESDQAGLLKSGLVISVLRQKPAAVVITDLATRQTSKEIPVYSTAKLAYLKVSHDQSTAAVVLEVTPASQNSSRTFEILTSQGDFDYMHAVAAFTGNTADCELRNLAVSDGGEFVALFGTKDNCGWVVLADTAQRKVVWEKRLQDFVLCFNAVFAPDKQKIYVRGSDSSVYEIDTASGEVLGRLLPVKDNKSTLMIQPVQTVTVSADGRLIAATVGGIVYVWDAGTKEKIFTKAAGHKLISGIAFSPDGRLLATSDLRQGGVVKIWHMPEK